jgi:hypothetical protein
MKKKVAPPAISPEEVPSPRAELTIQLEPFESNSPLEVPGPKAELIVQLEPDDQPPRLTSTRRSRNPAAI